MPNGIAAICLAMRDEFGLIPHVYFDWTEGSPLVAPATGESQPCRYWLTLPRAGR